MSLSTRATLGSCKSTYCRESFWMSLLFCVFLCVPLEFTNAIQSSTTRCSNNWCSRLTSTRLITALRAVRSISTADAVSSSPGFFVPGSLVNVNCLLRGTDAWTQVFLLNTRFRKKVVNLSSCLQ